MTEPDGDIPLAAGVTLPRSALRFQYSRGGGPGGQNVNKLNTRVELWASVDGIAGLTDAARQRLRQFAGKRLTQLDEVHLVADTHRTQDANRKEVIARLTELCIKAAREPRKRRKTRPTQASKQRRLEHKQRRSVIKQFRRSPGE